MANPFDFLAKAKPASLYKLAQKLDANDAAVMLAHLPTTVSIQVMAYMSEAVQADMMPAMRSARQTPPEQAAAVADAIKQRLLAQRDAPRPHPGPGSAPAPSPGPVTPGRPNPYAAAANPTASAVPPPPRPRPTDKPKPWVPRAATGSPINGPAIPGSPEPVTGDPFKSPLAKMGLMDLIGRAKDKLLPKAGTPAPASASPARQTPANRIPAGPPKRPAAREGVARSVSINPTPRVIGGKPPPRRSGTGAPDGKAKPGARSIDGKAILAAILREAGGTVRDNVKLDSPELFSELRKRMFVFDDLMLTDDNALARVFTAAPVSDSALALRFAAPALRDRVLRVVSPGRAEALRDPPAGRTGMDSIEKAQQAVLDIALRLQAAGRILIDPRDPDLMGE